MFDSERRDIPERLLKGHRLFQIAALLREKERTVRDLVSSLYPTISVGSGEWDAAKRAVQRDLADLKLLETDLESTSTRPPRYRIPTHRSNLHPTEALTLHVAARAIYHRAGGEARHQREALAKLNSWLPEHLRPVMERGFADLGTKRTGSRESQNLEKAAAAWLGAHPLAFEYQKPGGSGAWRPNIVEPYLIELSQQNLELYVVGRETTFHHDVRTFKLSRMRALQVDRTRTFKIPDTFDPREFFQSALGVVGTQGRGSIPIRLRFRRDAAYRVLEGGYSHLASLKTLADGRVEANIHAAPDSSGLPREVLAWIYSFGPRVEVMGPPDIRAHWLSELQEAVESAARNDSERGGLLG